jgi:hypothetical protein
MTASIMPATPAVPQWAVSLVQSRWAWCIAAVIFIGFRGYFGDTQALHKSLGDTDDATRLVQVRELLANGAWYDTTLARFGGATPLISHWSRLIDVPIALLISLFSVVLSTAGAELAVRILWPSLLLCLIMRLMLHEAELRAGQAGALILLALLVPGTIALFQFNLGRIDHHNVMILCAVGGLVMLARSFEDARAGTPAGLLLGLGMAVGYEAIAIVLPAIAVASIAATLEPRSLDGIKRAAIAMTGVLALVIAITIAPSQWLTIRCDALSLNIALLIGAGAGGLTIIAAYLSNASPALRVGALALTGITGVLLYAAVDPVCLGGPFAQVDPAVNPIWLSRVTETKNIAGLFKNSPVLAVVAAIYFTLGVAAAGWLWSRTKTIENAFLLLVVTTSAICGLWQGKFLPYASWFASFALTLVFAQLPAWRTLSTRAVTLAAVVFCSETTIDVVVDPLLQLAGQSNNTTTNNAKSDACGATPSLRLLNVAPKGLIVADIDFGPFIVANSHHSVIAAPYHRIDRAILAADRIQKAAPADAEAALRAAGATYVYECVIKPADPANATTATAKAPAPITFQSQLKAGATFSFLESVALPNAPPEMKLWRVKPL